MFSSNNSGKYKPNSISKESDGIQKGYESGSLSPDREAQGVQFIIRKIRSSLFSSAYKIYY